MIKIIEFENQKKVDKWLQEMGNKIKILTVNTSKRWSIWTGFLGDTKTYTITYEVL